MDLKGLAFRFSLKKDDADIILVGFDGSTKGNIMTTSSYESLTHSKWDCKYHLVFIPKGRKKALYGKVRKFLGPIFHELASQRGSKNNRGTHGPRSRAYVDQDSSKIFYC